MSNNDLLPVEAEEALQRALNHAAKALREACSQFIERPPSAADIQRQVENYIDLFESEEHPEKRTKVLKVVPNENRDGYIVHLQPVNPIVFEFTISTEEE
jgi:hypothetical protein